MWVGGPGDAARLPAVTATGGGVHLALPLGGLAGSALARHAAHVVLARVQVLAALGAEAELGAVAALLA